MNGVSALVTSKDDARTRVIDQIRTVRPLTLEFLCPPAAGRQAPNGRADERSKGEENSLPQQPALGSVDPQPDHIASFHRRRQALSAFAQSPANENDQAAAKTVSEPRHIQLFFERRNRKRHYSVEGLNTAAESKVVDTRRSNQHRMKTPPSSLGHGSARKPARPPSGAEENVVPRRAHEDVNAMGQPMKSEQQALQLWWHCLKTACTTAAQVCHTCCFAESERTGYNRPSRMAGHRTDDNPDATESRDGGRRNQQRPHYLRLPVESVVQQYQSDGGD